MKDRLTFTDQGWDFQGEQLNGNDESGISVIQEMTTTHIYLGNILMIKLLLI
jgi:hypothetical protein